MKTETELDLLKRIAEATEQTKELLFMLLPLEKQQLYNQQQHLRATQALDRAQGRLPGRPR